MGVFTKDAIIDFTTSGNPSGSAHFDGLYFAGVVSAGSIPKQFLDLLPSGASVGIAFASVVSSGDSNFVAPSVGSTLTASYVPLSNQVGEPVKTLGLGNVTETWTRTS